MRRLLIPAAGLAMLTGVVFGASCLIDRRTSEFACDNEADCAGLSGLHTCTNGFCVVVDAPPVPPCVSSDCVARGGTCDANDNCVFSNVAQVSCPDDVPCEIHCDVAGSCTNVNCGKASSCKVSCGADNTCGSKINCNSTECDVTCGGTGTCAAGVDCGQDRCTVKCTGDTSCGQAIQCHDSCACTVDCSGPGSCPNAAQCPDPQMQCATAPGCTAAPGPCSNC